MDPTFRRPGHRSQLTRQETEERIYAGLPLTEAYIRVVSVVFNRSRGLRSAVRLLAMAHDRRERLPRSYLVKAQPDENA